MTIIYKTNLNDERNQVSKALNGIDTRIDGVDTRIDGLFVGDIYRDVTSGEGEKIGPDPTGDFGWRDITGAVEVRGVGSNDPSWSQIGSGPFYGYKFAVGDECWMCFHIPHDIVPSSDIHLHTHYLTDGTNTNSVKWQYVYTYAKGFDQENFSATGTTITSETTPPGSAYRHMVSETAAITIATLTEPDGLIYVHISRITNGGTNNTDGVFMLTSDVHYQSTGLATKGKAPNFYA